ncbi:hypothetical protein ACTVZO_39925 [Streptomyces sp. IBSNAI002]|uniref:hypothetical protein n=1 Tax=Streptomyces sp. IBSNAI002 TaxID=3457500 RepID=UPI003FD0C8E6
MSSNWQTRFADLIAGNHSDTGDPVDAGAQLRIVDDEGNEVFLQALARNSVFLRVSNSPKSGFGGQLIWDDPSVLMRRSDYYAYNGDKYGVSPDKKKASGLTRDPLTIATHGASNNEIMFRDGIDLLGAEAPSRIVCHQAHQRTALLESFKARGITHLGGKPVEDVVKTQH